MNGEELRRLRERRGLAAHELAAAINSALGTNYEGDSVKRWERGRQPAAKVRAFLDELAAESLLDELGTVSGGGLEPDDEPLEPGGLAGDTAPPMPAAAPRLGSSGSTTWTRACEELWELVATGVGMVGAATSNPALMRDGEIILADKQALGAAWGRLAETNETFRRMLAGMTEGGVWLQVAMVTGTTVSKCWQSHQEYAAYLRVQRAASLAEHDGARADAAAA